MTEPAGDSYSVQDVVVGAPPPAVAAPAAPARGMTWTSSRRVLRVTASTRSYLVVNENFNPGWRAVVDGRQLRAVRLDGWKQAWLLPAGTAGVVTLTYLPNAIYPGAILAGWAHWRWPCSWPSGRGGDRRRSRPSSAGVAAPSRPPLPAGAAAPGEYSVMAWLVVAGGLVLAGLWLGGYPGAVLLPVAVGGSWASAGAPAGGRPVRGSWRA